MESISITVLPAQQCFVTAAQLLYQRLECSAALAQHPQAAALYKGHRINPNKGGFRYMHPCAVVISADWVRQR